MCISKPVKAEVTGRPPSVIPISIQNPIISRPNCNPHATAGAFKTRSAKLQKLLESSNTDNLRVEVNAEKPRKGCFEVRVGDTPVLSFLDMPRPFKQLKALDMEDVAAQVVAAFP